MLVDRDVVGQLVVTVPFALAHVGGGAVRGDAVHPGGELRVAAEAPQASVGTEIRLLHHVTRVLFIAGEPEGQGVRIEIRDLDQLIEGVPVPVSSGGDQLGHISWHR